MNARLHNALDEVQLFVDPKCKELIADLEQVVVRGRLDADRQEQGSAAHAFIGCAGISDLAAGAGRRVDHKDRRTRGAVVLMTHTHIEQEHPDYTHKARMWRRYRDLYAGGEQFRCNAAEYLLRRQKEPLEVYQERLARVFYENYLGSIVDWYTATLVRREPILEFTGTNDPAKEFFARFVQNCDLRGTTLTQFFKQQMTEALVCGKSYVVVDFPRTGWPGVDASRRRRVGAQPGLSGGLQRRRADQLELRPARRTGVGGDPDVAAEAGQRQAFGWKRETRWIYYDREKFEIYERRGADQKAIELTDRGQARICRNRTRARLRAARERRALADQ